MGQTFTTQTLSWIFVIHAKPISKSPILALPNERVGFVGFGFGLGLH